MPSDLTDTEQLALWRQTILAVRDLENADEIAEVWGRVIPRFTGRARELAIGAYEFHSDEKYE
jgi:hypothetical protein